MSDTSKTKGKAVFRKLTAATFGLALLGTAGQAHAILIDNGTTTIDTAAGLEWLDLTLTLGFSYNAAIASPFVTNDGYHVATTSEVCSLFTSLGDVLPNCLPGTGVDSIAPSSASSLFSLLGNPVLNAIIGFLDGGSISFGIVGAACLEASPSNCTSVGNQIFSSRNFDSTDATLPAAGIWLVRPASAVPEPNTMILFGAGMVGLIAAMRRRRWKQSPRPS